MMKKKQTSIDGFTLSREHNSERRSIYDTTKAKGRLSKNERHEINSTSSSQELRSGDGRSSEKDIQQTLRIIDKLNEVDSSDGDGEKSSRRQRKLERINRRRRKKNKSPLTWRQFTIRRWVKWIMTVLITILLFLGGLYAYRSFNAITQLAQGNLFDVFKKERLQQDTHGRTNILLFGTSPEEWDGADLADSIMVMTIKQDEGKVYTMSLPRDLYVKHSCKNYLGTTSGKLNESYICGKKEAETANMSDQDIELAAQKELAKAASDVLGLDIHYQVHANWKVLTDVVDVIGGIDVLVEAYDGSPLVYDPSANIRYKNGEIVHMNGNKALAFSRARGAFGGVGLSGGNFDRERNQQKVLAAIIQKIKDTNKADINTMTNILSSLGDNIRTSFETKELQTLVDLANILQPNKIQPIPLVGDDLSLLTTSNINGVSVVIPTAGTYNYQQIQSHIQRKTNSNEASQEEADVVVLNASGVPGVAAKHQDKLTKQGFKVLAIGNATSEDKSVVLYDLSGTKPHTLAALKKLYGDVVRTKDQAPDAIKQYNADIIIVINKED